MKTNKTIVCGFFAVLLALAFSACNDGSKDDNSASDVYLAGIYEDAATGTDTPCYWKNGARTNLPVPAEAKGYADDIAVSANGDVYVLGHWGDEEIWEKEIDFMSCYWKNGVRTNLPEGSYAYAIAAR